MSEDRCPFCAAKHACPKCGTPVPANLGYDDFCLSCGEWRFTRVPRMKADDPNVLSPVRYNFCPRWEPRPPSEVGDRKRLRRPKPRRGRPTVTNGDEDRKLVEDWGAARRQGATRASFARDRGITVADLIKAQDRVEYRRGKGEE